MIRYKNNRVPSPQGHDVIGANMWGNFYLINYFLIPPLRMKYNKTHIYNTNVNACIKLHKLNDKTVNGCKYVIITYTVHVYKLNKCNQIYNGIY